MKSRPAERRPLRHRFLDGIIYLSRRQALAVALVMSLLAGASLLYVRDLPIRTDYLDLLPKNDPLIETYETLQAELEGVDYMAVVLTLAVPPASLEERRGLLFEAGDELLRQLDHHEIRGASYRLGEGIELPDELLLFRILDADSLLRLREIAEQVVGELPTLPEGELIGLQTALAETPAPTWPTREEVNTLSRYVDSFVSVGRTAVDALEVLPDVQPLLSEAARLIRAVHDRPPPEDSGEPLFARDYSRLIVQVWPRRGAHESLTYNREITRLVGEAAAAADLDRWGVESAVAGSYATVSEMDQIIRRDMLATTVIASAAVLILLLLMFSSLFLTLVALVPMLVSALLTMAWAKLAVGGFNLVTAFLPALVLGYGIDFTVHLLARYAEERTAGRSVGAACARAIYSKGDASLTAALTTGIVFLSLLVSRSTALAEMGVIMVVGTAFTYLAAVLLTPSMITLAYVTFRRRFREPVPRGQAALQRMYRHLLVQRRVLVSVFLVLTLALLYQAAQVRFRFTSAELAPATRSRAAAEEIIEDFDLELQFGEYFVLFSESPEQLQQLEAVMEEREEVRAVRSIRYLLPQELLRGRASLADLPIREATAAMASLQEDLQRLDEILAQLDTTVVQMSQLELRAVLGGWGDTAEAVTRSTAGLIRLSDSLAGLDRDQLLPVMEALEGDLAEVGGFLDGLDALPPEPEMIRQLVGVLPAELRSQYYTPEGRYVLRVLMHTGLSGTPAIEAFISWIRTLGVDYFGLQEITVHLEGHMKRDFALSTILAALLIVLAIWRSFRNLREAALALMPLLIGYVWMLAGMYTLDIAFNFTNIVISPLLIGLGVDSAVHILHRIEEERATGPGSVARGAAASAVPTTVTAVATMIVFGALLAARTPGLRLLGISAVVGLGFTLLGSVFVLPSASLGVERKRRGH